MADEEGEHTPLCVRSLHPMPGGFRGRDSQPAVGLSVHVFMKAWKDIFVTDELCEVVPAEAMLSLEHRDNRSRLFGLLFLIFGLLPSLFWKNSHPHL